MIYPLGNKKRLEYQSFFVTQNTVGQISVESPHVKVGVLLYLAMKQRPEFPRNSCWLNQYTSYRISQALQVNSSVHMLIRQIIKKRNPIMGFLNVLYRTRVLQGFLVNVVYFETMTHCLALR